MRRKPVRTLVAGGLDLRGSLPYWARIKITGTGRELAGRYTSARSTMPSRIGTATFAVFVTAHGPAPDDGGGAAAQAAVPASATAAGFIDQRKALPQRQCSRVPGKPPTATWVVPG